MVRSNLLCCIWRETMKTKELKDSCSKESKPFTTLDDCSSAFSSQFTGFYFFFFYLVYLMYQIFALGKATLILNNCLTYKQHNHSAEPNLKSMRGLGYIQSSPAFFILPHIYNCPPPNKQIKFSKNQKKFVKKQNTNLKIRECLRFP